VRSSMVWRAISSISVYAVMVCSLRFGGVGEWGQR
jgi:hypothetical protein